MPLFRKVHVIRTGREPPGRPRTLGLTLTCTTALALCLVIARSGYRIPVPEVIGWVVRLFEYLTLALFAADVVLG